MMSRGTCMVRCVREVHGSTALGLRKKPWWNPHRTTTNPDHEDPDYFEKEAAKVFLGPKYIDTLNNLFAAKLSFRRDLGYKADDSLVKPPVNFGLPELEPWTPRYGYENVEALKTAPLEVKKIFSVEFGERADKTMIWKKQLIELVRRNPYDNESLESRIARYTALIRSWSILVDDTAKYTEKKPKVLLRLLRLTLVKRRMLLKELRDTNKASFERVLKELKISYHVPPLPEDIPRFTRKGWVEFQVRKRVEAERERKLKEYHLKLLKEQKVFEAEKEKRWEALEAEERALKEEIEKLEYGDGQVLDVVGKYPGRHMDFMAENLFLKYYYWKPGDHPMTLPD